MQKKDLQLDFFKGRRHLEICHYLLISGNFEFFDSLQTLFWWFLLNISFGKVSNELGCIILKTVRAAGTLSYVLYENFLSVMWYVHLLFAYKAVGKIIIYVKNSFWKALRINSICLSNIRKNKKSIKNACLKARPGNIFKFLFHRLRATFN